MISLVVRENGCIEYQNIVYEIRGGGEVTCSASGELYLYDMDHSGELYHITNAA